MRHGAFEPDQLQVKTSKKQRERRLDHAELHFAEDQRRIGAAETKAVRHNRGDINIFDTFTHNRHTFRSFIKLIDVG